MTNISRAEAVIVLSGEGAVPADILAGARIAGILAAKKTGELIPLHHAAAPTRIEVAIETPPGKNDVHITAEIEAKSGGQTKALAAVTIAALAVLDAYGKSARIEQIGLIGETADEEPFEDFPIRPPRWTPPTQSTPHRTHARPTVLIGEVAAPPPPRADGTAKREAFRNFMTTNHLRATDWAKQAGVPAAEIYAFLTGRLPAIPEETAQRLARVAQVRVEDMFR